MNISREDRRSINDVVRDAIGAKVEAGELIPADVHETTVDDLTARLARVESVMERIKAANYTLMRHLEAARARIRELDEANQSLRAHLRRRDHGD